MNVTSQRPDTAGDAAYRTRNANEMDRARWLVWRQRAQPDTEDGQHQREMRRLLDDTANAAVIVLVDGDGQAVGLVEVSRRLGLPQFGPGAVALLDGVMVEPEVHAVGLEGLIAAARNWAAGRGCRWFVSVLTDADAVHPSLAGLLDQRMPAVPMQVRRMELKAAAVTVPAGSGAAEVKAAVMPLATDGELILPSRAEDPAVPLTPAGPSGAGGARGGGWFVPVCVGLLGVYSFSTTDIFSGGVWSGALAPIVDAAVVLYFTYFFLSRRYRRQTRPADERLESMMERADPPGGRGDLDSPET